jgi:ABC-type Fe3+/spermidine/putrescine transport system ATPase subunit
MSVLRVTDIEVRRGGRTIVSGATFSAEAGETVALVGASGSGKTTVLRAIAGLEPLSAGSIAADGRVGMVFQFHYLFPHLSALQNVALAPVHVLRQSPADAERRARDLLVQLDVDARAAALPHESPPSCSWMSPPRRSTLPVVASSSKSFAVLLPEAAPSSSRPTTPASSRPVHAASS